jgi:hypothetical protein
MSEGIYTRRTYASVDYQNERGKSKKSDCTRDGTLWIKMWFNVNNPLISPMDWEHIHIL